jgi:hypothetical protein
MARSLATVIPVLRQLKEQAAGTLSPAVILDAARSEDSPLHHFFTWDDGEAAEKCRLAEAGMLLRRVRVHLVRIPQEVRQIGVELVRIETTPRSVRFLQAPRVGSGRARGYRSVEEIAADPELAADMIGTLRGELVAWIRRAQEYCDSAMAAGRADATLQSVVDTTASIVNEAWPAFSLKGVGRGDGSSVTSADD